METPKSTGGRPPHHPTAMHRRLVETLASEAISQAQICLVLGVSEKTLRKHYPDEIRRGSALVEAKLVGHLLRLASGNDGTALKAIKFSLACRFGWSQYAPPR